MKKQLIILFVIILGIITLLFFIKTRLSPVPVVDELTSIAPTLEGANAVYAPDQAPGNTILVSQVVTESPSFVVIHEADKAGEPGVVIGQSTLIAASTEDVVIELTTATTAGDELYAVLVKDDGDGVYTEGTDLPYTTESGQSVMSSFEILSQPTTPLVSQ